jgi:WD40 repeat protein/serine/threonine protein kinase
MPLDPQHVKAVFLGAVARPPAERGAFLEQECAADAELRQRVERLLQAHERPDSLPDEPAAPGPTGDRQPGEDGQPTDGPDSEQAPSPVIGPYKLIQKIGEGGMGTVYMAQQTHPVKRVVALKLIKPGMDSRQVLARFEAERQALALMDHPHIARVLDAGTADGQPYFVMELVKGVPITRYCDQHHLGPRERLELFVAVCQAVQHAHQKGIIHRDLKPSNVLVARYDGKPVPKVIDFGVAKAAGPQLTERTLVTGFGALVGTLEYMSPEQAELNQLDIDTRSDIYALGVLLYELLTGSTPLEGKRLKETALLEALRLIREEEPPRPSTRLSTTREMPTIAANRGLEPKNLSRLVKGELDWIVMKCLEKDRSRRYETANGLARDIERHLHDEPVRACPPSVGYRLRKLARRNRVALTTAAVVAATLLLGTLVSSWLAVRATWAENAERQVRQDLEDALAEANVQKQAAIGARNDALQAQGELEEQLYFHRIALAEREWLANNVRRSLDLLRACPPERRHWEWHYLRRLHETGFVTLHGHQGSVRDVVYGPDGKVLASAGEDGVVIIWDAATHNKLRVLPGEGESVTALAFHPDGKQLAAGGATGDITLWDWRQGEIIRHWKGHEKGIPSVEYSPDGELLATFGLDRRLKVWDPGTDKERHTLKVNAGWGYGGHRAKFSPDGTRLVTTRLVSGQTDGPVIWNLKTGEVTSPLVGHQWGVLAVGWNSRQDQIIASADADGRVILWDLTTRKRLNSLQGHEGGLLTLAFSPSGTYLAAAGADHSVRIWHILTAENEMTLRGHTAPINAVAYAPDGRHLASASDDGTVRIWDVIHGQRPLSSQDHTNKAHRTRDLAFAPDGGSVAFACRDTGFVPYVGILDVETARWRPGPEGHEQSASRVVYSPDGRYLISAGDDRTVRVWDRATQALVYQLEHEGRVSGLAISADGSVLATAARNTVSTWRVADGKPLQEHPVPAGTVNGIALTPDGKQICIAGADRVIRILDRKTGRKVHVLRGHAAAVLDVSVDRSGRWLASAGADHTARLWRLEDGEPIREFKGHTNRVTRALFSPDAERLFTSSGDGTVRIWETRTGRLVLTLKAHPAIVAETNLGVAALALSPDGTRLVSASGVGYLKVWDASPLDVRYARGVAARWVLSAGGKLRMREAEAAEAADLPSGPLTVTGVTFTSASRITDEDLARLKTFDELRDLDLTGAAVTPAAVAHLRELKQLRSLRLSGTLMTGAAVQELRKSLPDCRIEWEGYEQDRRAAEWVCSAGGTVTVRQGGVRQLARAAADLPASPFRVVEIDLTDPPGVQGEDLARLKGLTALEVLRLWGPGIGDAALRHLTTLTALESLHLWGTAVTGTGFSYLKDLHQLRRLSCGYGTPITDEGLARLPSLKNLTGLWIYSKRLTDEGLRHLARHSGLKEVGLGKNLSGKGLRHLTTLRWLHVLTLNDCNLTDDSLAHLSRIPSLQKLVMNNTPLSDAGLKHLHGLGDLRELQVKGTYVTADGVAALRTRLPSCRVEYETVRRPEEVLAELTKAIEEDPGDASRWQKRAEYHQRYQRWPEAAADFEQAVKLQPRNGGLRVQTARVQLTAGDEEAYRRHRQVALRRLLVNPKAGAGFKMHAARVCSLLPGSGKHHEVLLEGARQAARKFPDQWHFASAPGPVLYRMGRYEEALKVLRQTQKLTGRSLSRQAVICLWLAMTYHQMKQEGPARRALAEASRLIDDVLPGPGEDLGYLVYNYVECRTLCREAEALILGAEDARPRHEE